MWPVVALIAALVVVGIAALGLRTAQHLSLPNGQTTLRNPSPPAAQPSTSMSPWPDLEALTHDDSRPTEAASLDGSVSARPKSDFQSRSAPMATPSYADEGAPRLPSSPSRAVPHKSVRTGLAGHPRH